jgi:transcription termination/antitermination protein NusG
MDWYSLFVNSGKEEVVSQWLKLYFPDLEVTSLIPKRKLIEQKQRKKQLVLKKMFPGYVLVNMEMDLNKYYKLKKIPYIIRILNSGEYYTKISQEEMALILHLLIGGDVVDFSSIYIVNSKVIVRSGPLEGMEGLITSVDRRKMRAKIIVPFMGLVRKIDVGIEVLDKISV